MPLDTQQFEIKRHWLASGLAYVPMHPEIFSNKQLSEARKLFLAGKNQLAAIRNWLEAAGVISSPRRGQVALSDLGQLMAAQDPRAEMAWTWWLFHLHLCCSDDAFPYAAFFLRYEPDGRWMSLDDIIRDLTKIAEEKKLDITEDTVSTYFGGIAQTFRPGHFVNDLLLVEERIVGEARRERRIRRRLAHPEDVLVAYAASLIQKQFCPGQATVEARVMLSKGLARFLGMRDPDVREALSRISVHRELSQYVQYRQQANQDSVQFPKSGDAVLKVLRSNAYRTMGVKWQ